MSDTWRRGDCSLGFRGDLKSALGSIRAKMWILPGSTDQVRAPPGPRSRSPLSRASSQRRSPLVVSLDPTRARHGQYFRKEEIEAEAAMVPDAVFRPLESCMGHIAEYDEACQPAISGAIAEALAHAGLGR